MHVNKSPMGHIAFLNKSSSYRYISFLKNFPLYFYVSFEVLLRPQSGGHKFNSLEFTLFKVWLHSNIANCSIVVLDKKTFTKKFPIYFYIDL